MIHIHIQIYRQWKCYSCKISNIGTRVTLHKKWSFPLRISPVNMTKSAVSCSLVTFTIEILNGKLQVLCSITQIIETEKKDECSSICNASKCLKCGVFSGPCFPLYSYLVQIRKNTDQKKMFERFSHSNAQKMLVFVFSFRGSQCLCCKNI